MIFFIQGPSSITALGILTLKDRLERGKLFDDLENGRPASAALSSRTWEEAMRYPARIRAGDNTATGWEVWPSSRYPRNPTETYYLSHTGSWSGYASMLYRISRVQPRCNLWVSIACNVDNYGTFTPREIAHNAEKVFCPK